MTDLDQHFADQLGIAGGVTYVLELLKSWKLFPWINRNSDKLNRILSVVASVAYTAGFRFAFTGSLVTGGQAVFSIPALADVAHLLVDSSRGFVLQELIYKLGIKNGATPMLPPPLPPTDQEQKAAAEVEMKAAEAALAEARKKYEAVSGP